MRNIHRAIALSGLLVLLTFATALGQTDRQTIIYIPFNFTVGEKAFSAGKYVIERNKKESDTVWVVRRKDDSGAVFVMTRPVQSLDTQESTRLVFSRYEDLYFLQEIWIAGSNTGRQIQTSSQEKALDKALSMKRQTQILIARGR